MRRRQRAAKPGAWLDPNDWARVQRSVPIACVDLLPLRWTEGAGPRPSAFGLILRIGETGEPRWGLVGGRVLLGEMLDEALTRHVAETLGPLAEVGDLVPGQPTAVAEYFPDIRPGLLHDPRQHSIALTYCLPVTGEIAPRGEALDFRWFDIGSAPGAEAIGFGQHGLIVTCMRRLGIDDPPWR